MGNVKSFCKVIILIAAATLWLPASSFAEANPKARENLFKSHCVLCHGADATGDTALGKQLKAKNLRSAIVQKNTDAELKQLIMNGKGGMPPFSDQLTGAQIDELISYIRQLGKSKK